MIEGILTRPMKRPMNQSESIVGDESGSLSLLIISLFFITLVLSFAIIDISGALVAKRQLINIGEAAISRAAHNIDLPRYYAGEWKSSGVSTSGMSPQGENYLVPIDCLVASRSLESEIASSMLHGSEVHIESFTCDGDVIHATISSEIAPTLALPILQGSVMNRLLTITATISASNEIRAS